MDEDVETLVVRVRADTQGLGRDAAPGNEDRLGLGRIGRTLRCAL